MSAKRLLGFVSTVALLSGCQSWQKTDFDAMPPTASLPPASQDGRVQVRYWDNISGVKLSTLTALPTFPDNPDTVEELTELRGPINRADYYGTLVRGFIIPPTTGRYRFFVSADDAAQFWLSDSDTTGNKELIASAPAWTGLEQYTKYTSQTSPWQDLTSGNRYYFEIVHKEGTRGDHFAVAWEGPGIAQQIVSVDYLASFGRPLYPDSEEIRTAYSLGYRVGFLDGRENLTFNPDYPPLDEDKDGLYDNWEIVYGLDPTDPDDAASDIDGDFLSALDEFWVGTDPTNPDTDGDGIPDGVEFAYGLDPLNPADADEDMDGDGYSNLEEYLAGTDMSESSDAPADTTDLSFVSGFTGQYFRGRNFDEPLLVRLDNDINFNWGGGSPGPGIPADYFSVRWTGIFTAPHGEGTRDYEFTSTTDDGVRLYFNDQIAINQWVNQGGTPHTATIALNPGEELKLTFEYYENAAAAKAILSIRDALTGNAVSVESNTKTPDPFASSSVDSDGDGIPDTWELRNGLNPWIDDAQAIANSEGISNIQAYQSGLNPWTLEPVPTPEASPVSPDPIPTAPPPVTESSATLSWTAPLTRVDGSSISLSEIGGYIIRYGQSRNNLDLRAEANSAQTSIELTGLEPGTWYFSISVSDTNGLESAPSDVVEHVVR